MRPRPRLFSQGQGQDLVIQGQGQDLHEVSSRILEAKTRPRGQQDWNKPINESVVHTVLDGSRTVASVGDRVEDRDTSRPLRRRNTVRDRTSEAPRSSRRTTTNTASQYHFSICVVTSYSTKNGLFDRALFCHHARANEPLFTVV